MWPFIFSLNSLHQKFDKWLSNLKIMYSNTNPIKMVKLGVHLKIMRGPLLHPHTLPTHLKHVFEPCHALSWFQFSNLFPLFCRNFNWELKDKVVKNFKELVYGDLTYSFIWSSLDNKFCIILCILETIHTNLISKLTTLLISY
jgi:hypothetical protein